MTNTPQHNMFLFIGMSVPLEGIPNRTKFNIYPPIKRGDLGKLELIRGDTVIIIDGEFGQNLAVSPKEIIAVLDRGILVYGASSMGALRAVELNNYGMFGFGWVFDKYRSGQIMKDDEVALLYNPYDYTQFSVPLVNVRYWFDQLVEQDDLTRALADKILYKLSQLYFGKRTIKEIESITDRMLHRGSFAKLKMQTSDEITDIKKRDAIELLQLLTTKEAVL